MTKLSPSLSSSHTNHSREDPRFKNQLATRSRPTPPALTYRSKMRFTFATSLALLVHPLLTISLASPTPVNGLAITGDLPVAFVATALPSGKPGSLEYKALKAHNDFRALHGAKALVWSTKLAAGAKMLVLFPKNGKVARLGTAHEFFLLWQLSKQVHMGPLIRCCRSMGREFVSESRP
mgnify:CR=1 FL=1